jgi:hypothetical protein
MSNQIVTIKGVEYTIEPVTVAMASALLRASSVMEMAAGRGLQLEGLTADGFDNVVAALEAVTGAAPGIFADLPLDELVTALTQTAVAFITVNGPYVVEKVVPACNHLAATFAAVQRGFKSATASPAPAVPDKPVPAAEPGPAPRQPRPRRRQG